MERSNIRAINRGSSDAARRARTSSTSKQNVKEVGTIIVRDYDYIIFFIVIVLTLFGVLMIFSSSYYKAGMGRSGDVFEFLKKQGVFAVMGFAGMLGMSTFNYTHLRRFTGLLYLFANVSLVLVLFFAPEINGARRWLEVPFLSFQFQPSELAKLAVILSLARMISTNKSMFKDISGFIWCGAVALLPIALIALGGNLSTVLIIVAITAGIIFVVTPYFWRYIFLALGGVAGLVSFLMFGAEFRRGRLAVWLDPFSDPTGVGYQILQSLYAVASGGLFGLGLGQSRQKLGYIPEAYNDIIFAVICEELGFFGAMFLLFMFGLLIWRGIKTAIQAPDLFSCLIVTGIVLQIAVQLIVNVAVVTNLIPNTGIPMPFVSYGGTALIVNMFSMGIILSVSRYSRA